MGQAKSFGRAVATRNASLRSAQGGFDGLAFAGIKLPVEFLPGLGTDQRSRVNLQTAILRQNDGAFDDVLHLTDVTRPGIPHQRVHDFRRDAFDAPAHPLRKLPGEMTHEQRNVFGALAQRRQQDGKHIQAIKKIAAKFTLRPAQRPGLDLDKKICPEVLRSFVVSMIVKPERHIMKQTNRYICSALIVAAGLITGWALADEKSDRARNG
jgi:hypothetical protein